MNPVGMGKGAAKVILLGEHSVVHGYPALVMSLGEGVTAIAQKGDAPLVATIPNWQMTAHRDGKKPADRALFAICSTLGLGAATGTVEVDANIPAGAGLGASAALACAVARSLNNINQLGLDDCTIRDAIAASEDIYHHRASGVDGAAAMSDGGLLRFTISEGPTLLSTPTPRILVVHSGQSGSTAKMVRLFGDRKKNHPQGKRRLDALGSLADQSITALATGQINQFGQMMNLAHRHLQWFGVSTPRLDRICQVALDAGALGAKLTGGGGGGCAVILPGKAETAIRTALGRLPDTTILELNTHRRNPNVDQ